MSSMFLIAIVVHVLLATATGYVGVLQDDQPHFPTTLRNPRIIGGIRTRIQRFPYQLSLQRSYVGGLIQRHICGAAIISEDWAITAAHCVFGKLPENLQLRAGTSLYFIGGQIRDLKKYYIYDIYEDMQQGNDIALLKVNEPFTFSNWVQPIPLETGEIETGAMATLTGWGLSREGAWMHPLQLRMTFIPIISRVDCREFYWSSVKKNDICAGNKEGRACHGDSGAPLTVEGKLVGIGSLGGLCEHPDRPGVYAKVSAYIQWINKVTGANVTKDY